LVGRRAPIHGSHAPLKHLPEGLGGGGSDTVIDTEDAYCNRGSPKGSSSGFSSGSLNSSLAHAPKSTPLQRALQKGR
jgi:hypothetical protein